MASTPLELDQLRISAQTIFSGRLDMAPFKCGRYGCPWLEAQARKHVKRPRGLLLMQDWGVAEEESTLEESIENVLLILNGTRPPVVEFDSTQRNLFGSKPWATAIQGGDWWVSNAVWALRKSGKKCGYLGDSLHKQAFPIWLEVIRDLARGNDNFQLVVSGAWARFDNRKDQISCLKTYLAEWVKWSSRGRSTANNLYLLELADSCRGSVWYVDHPSIWSKQVLQAGPPAFFTA